jgi:hypothetical protein
MVWGAGGLAAGAAAESIEAVKVWVDDKARYEVLLRTAEVTSVEDIGMGVTAPKKVHLKQGELTLKGVFKPIQRGRQKGFWESYQGEVAAYEFDKVLGLDMVPPTVVREIDGKRGSLQLWVEGCKLYRDVQSGTPQSVDWSHQLSRMKLFDSLICNRDRNAQNFLVSSDWVIVLIDHSRAFISDKKIPSPPVQVARGLLEKLKALNLETIEPRFEGIMGKGDIKNILARRDALLAHFDKLIAEKGEALVVY